VILQVALDLVDREGIGALTMRRLATALGVATMSLYSHVPNKDDLVLGVVNAATAKMALPPPDTPPWEALRSIIREFRRVSQLHPNLVPLIMQRPPTGPESLRTLEAALDALRRAGLDPAATACAYRMTASFAIGFVSLESGGFFRPVDEGDGGRTFDLADLGGLPRVLEMAPELASWDSDAEFESGLDVLIDALQAQDRH
jgi:AcrR family transcriptional regulator